MAPGCGVGGGTAAALACARRAASGPGLASGPVEPVVDPVLREEPVKVLCALLGQACCGRVPSRRLLSVKRARARARAFSAGEHQPARNSAARPGPHRACLGVELAVGGIRAGVAALEWACGGARFFVVGREYGGGNPLYFWLPSFLSPVYSVTSHRSCLTVFCRQVSADNRLLFLIVSRPLFCHDLEPLKLFVTADTVVTVV